MKLNNLLILSGNDIPFPEAQLSVHQPTIKQIGLIGQSTLFGGIQILRFEKNNLTEQGKTELQNYSNFEVIMSIIKDKSTELAQNHLNVRFVLALLFPNYNIHFSDTQIILEKEQNIYKIDDSNLSAFQQILAVMFGQKKTGESTQQYNPGNDAARAIAQKLKKGKMKAAQQNAAKVNPNASIFGRYVSILSVGEHKDMNQLLNYTVPQLLDQFQRYNLKQQYDLYIKQKLAGAKDVKEVQDWTKDLYVQSNNNNNTVNRTRFDKI